MTTRRTVRLRTRPLGATTTVTNALSSFVPATVSSIFQRLTPNVLRERFRALMERGDHWAVEIGRGGQQPYLLVDLERTGKLSTMRSGNADPGDFRAISGAMSALVRRFYGETESTNAEILRRGTRAIGRQNTYRLFSSNCQRFAINVGHEIQILSTFEFDLIYGQEMVGQAEKNIGLGRS